MLSCSYFIFRFAILYIRTDRLIHMAFMMRTSWIMSCPCFIRSVGLITLWGVGWSLVVRRVHRVLKARHLILITRLSNVCSIHCFSLFIGHLRNLLERLSMFSVWEVINQFASNLIDKVCTVGFGRVLIHDTDHVGARKVDSACNYQGLIFLILLDNTLILWHAWEARSLLRARTRIRV